MANCERLEYYLVTVTNADIDKLLEAAGDDPGMRYCYTDRALNLALKQAGLSDRFVAWGAHEVDTEDDVRRRVALLRAAREGAGK